MYRVPDQHGRRVIVTGANSGTGKETAKRLAGAGAHVILAVRSVERGETARTEIAAAVPGASLEVRRIDLADFASVRAFADGILAEDEPVHTLVNNAGVMTPPNRIETVDGHELQFGSNFLGPFLLTNLLLPKLLEIQGARVATMASGTANYGRIRFHDLDWRLRYTSSLAYAQSKLADLLMAVRLAEIADERGWSLRSTAAHPGYTRTNLQTAGVNLARSADTQKPPIRRTFLPSQGVEEGTEPLLFAAADPGAEQGAYYGPQHGLTGPAKRAKLPRSARRGPDLAASVWAIATELTGVRDLAADTAGRIRG